MFNKFPVGSKCRTYENEIIDPSSLFDFNYEDKSKFSKTLRNVFGSPTLPTLDNRNIVIHCQSPLAGEQESHKNSLSSILNFSKFIQSCSKSEIFSSTPSKNSPVTISNSTIGNKHVNTQTRSPANKKNVQSSKFRSDALIQNKSFNGFSNSPWLNNNVKTTFCSPQSVKSIKEVVNEAIGGKCKDLLDNAVSNKRFHSRETRLESIIDGNSEDLAPPTSTNISSDFINLPQCCKELFPNSSKPDEVISCTGGLSGPRKSGSLLNVGEDIVNAEGSSCSRVKVFIPPVLRKVVDKNNFTLFEDSLKATEIDALSHSFLKLTKSNHEIQIEASSTSDDKVTKIQDCSPSTDGNETEKESNSEITTFNDKKANDKLLVENLDDATRNKLPTEKLEDATHNKLPTEKLEDATHNILPTENLEDATHNKLPSENLDDATHNKLPAENFDDATHNKLPAKNFDDASHNKLPPENLDDATHNKLPSENLDDASHNKLPPENLDDATHNKLPAENFDDATHNKLPAKNFDDASHNKLPPENFDDATHNKLPVVNLGDANICADYKTKIPFNPMAVADHLSPDKTLKPPTKKSTVVSFKLKNRSFAQSIKHFSSIGVIKPSFVKITRLSKNKKPKQTIKNSPRSKSTRNRKTENRKAKQRKVTLPVVIKEPDQYILNSNLTSPNKTKHDMQPSKSVESECSKVVDSNINMESLIEDLSNESLDSKILNVDEGNAPPRDDGLDDVSVLEDILLDLSFLSDGDRRDLGMSDDELSLSSEPDQQFKNSNDCNTESTEVSKQSHSKSQITTSVNEDTTTIPSYNILKSKPVIFKDSENQKIDSDDNIKPNCTVTPTSSNSTLKNSPYFTSLCTDSQTINTKSVTDCNSTLKISGKLNPTAAILDSYLNTSTKGGRKNDNGPSLPPRVVAIENRILAKYGPVAEKQRLETNQKITEGVINLVNELCFDGPSHSSTVKSNAGLSNEQLKASFANTQPIEKTLKSSAGQCSKPKKVTLRRSIGLPKSAEGNFNDTVAVKRKFNEEDEKIESQPKRLRSVVFISEDADENRDNEHPDWQFYKCSTPEQVYSYIKERWHNSSAANPYVNLTASRRRQFVKETEELQCSASSLILKRSRDLLNEGSGFKGKRSREENLNEKSSQPPSKRRKINEDEMEFSLTHARRCERTIHEDFTEVTSNWNSSLPKYKMEKIREDFNKKLHQVEIGYQEVRDICYFYSELFDFDQNSSMYRTEMEEIENLYGQFMEFYNWSGREFCSLHAEKN